MIMDNKTDIRPMNIAADLVRIKLVSDLQASTIMALTGRPKILPRLDPDSPTIKAFNEMMERQRKA